MRPVSLISTDLGVGAGHLACVTGTGVPIIEILDRLAVGRTEEQIVRWAGSSRYGADRNPLTPAGVRAAASYAAALTRETELSRPREAALVRDLPDDVRLEDARRAASAVLEDLAGGAGESEIQERRDLSLAVLRASVAYAARLARDERLTWPGETPDETFLRDLLTASDHALVEDAYAFADVFFRATPEKLLRKWQAFVEEVEGGYDDIYDEYVHALYLRDRLEDTVHTLVSPTSEERVALHTRPWDRRFEAATEPIERAIFPLVWTMRRWWWYRVPRNTGKELLTHLTNAGLMPKTEPTLGGDAKAARS